VAAAHHSSEPILFPPPPSKPDMRSSVRTNTRRNRYKKEINQIVQKQVENLKTDQFVKKCHF